MLAKAYREAPYKHDRDDIERAMNRIMSESIPIKMLREDLLKATKAKDRVAVKKIVEHMNKIRQDETYGKEIS